MRLLKNDARENLLLRLGIVFHKSNVGSRAAFAGNLAEELPDSPVSSIQIALIFPGFRICDTKQQRRNLFVEFALDLLRKPLEFAERTARGAINQVFKCLRIAAKRNLAECRH